jgi:hypothetical protein
MNITQIEQLQKIQYKCMRLILNEDWYANINYMLNCLEWLSVDQRIKLNALSFINKIENNLTPQYMKDFLIKRKELHTVGFLEFTILQFTIFVYKLLEFTIDCSYNSSTFQ